MNIKHNLKNNVRKTYMMISNDNVKAEFVPEKGRHLFEIKFPSGFCNSRNKKFIEENYHRDISVSDIAAASGISQSLLFRLFN